MFDLDKDKSIPLFPLGDRPILQHIIEALVTQGITSIEFILWHAPERIEALLGNGDRWGCSFRYHLATQHDRPYRSLKVIEKTKSEPWVLIHADRYPCVTFGSSLIETPILYCNGLQVPQNETSQSGSKRISAIENWGGTVVFPAGETSDILCNKTFSEMLAYLQQSLSSGQATAISVPDWINANTPDGLLDTQSRLLSGKLSGLMVSGIERELGIWISRNVEIHPTAKLIAPLYIGPNCRINRGVKLGPDVVISGDCIIDSNTSIDQSLTTAGSYIGEGLELSKTIVDHNMLVNVRLGTKVDISDSFLLGGLEAKHQQGWLARAVQCVFAALLIILFAPISLLSLLYFAIAQKFSYLSVQMVKVPLGLRPLSLSTYPLPCLGADAWRVHRPAGWSPFVRQFLPGLFAVLTGRLSLVGLPPKSANELERLPQEWRALYVTGRSGLITESALATSNNGDETELYLADAYYAARRNWLHDLKLASQYMFCLFVPSRNAQFKRDN